MRYLFSLFVFAAAVLICALYHDASAETSPSARQVIVREASDYVFGGYRGTFVSPPSADGNPKRGIIIEWPQKTWRLVFWHEASYCPLIELADGSGACFQFFEGNGGWAELFNQFGRMEANSFVDVIERGPGRVHIRWTYYGVNQQNGERAYRGIEDFYCLPNGLVLRRQSYRSLLPERHEGYAREPIELIGMCPAGKLWKDVLVAGNKEGERHALAVLDPFSPRRYDVYWQSVAGSLSKATPRREGSEWREIDDAAGVVMALPMKAGTPFCVFGTASGFDPRLTRLKEHSHADTGGVGWVSMSWDHWPVGWLNSQAHPVDAKSLPLYPNHFSPAGMDLFAAADADTANKDYWSLIGVGGADVEAIRKVARLWLELSSGKLRDPRQVGSLPMPDAQD